MEKKVQNETNETNKIKPVSDTLLVLNIQTNAVEMVKGVDKDGNLQKFPPEEKKDNDQLIKVDKHGDLFSNFFSNFYRQLKNPSHFNFFRVSECDAVNTAKDLQHYVDQASPAEKEKLKEYKVYQKIQTHLKIRIQWKTTQKLKSIVFSRNRSTGRQWKNSDLIRKSLKR
jgi:hypothetical protein